MGISSDPRLSTSTAGIKGLFTEYNQIAPHRLLMEREREFIRENSRDSFDGMRALSAKAASTIALVEGLEDSLREGREFFLQPDEGMFTQTDPVFKARQLLYEIGRLEGFDRLRRNAIRNREAISVALSTSISRDEIEQAVDKTLSLERSRIALGEKITQSLEECYQLLAKESLVLGGVCALAGVTDHEAFAIERRNDTRKAKQKIMEWCYRSADAGEAFATKITIDGWLGSMAALGKALEGTNAEELQSTMPLGKLIPVERKALLAEAVVTILDRIGKLAREEAQLGVCPRRDTFHMLFLLEELEKDPPEQFRRSYEQELRVVTHRLLSHPQADLFIIGIEHDGDLCDSDKQRLFRHIESVQEAGRVAVDENVPSYERVPHERRTEIRRQIREAQRAERASDTLRGLLHIDTADEVSEAPRRKDGAEILFFSPTVERDFVAWKESLIERVREDVQNLLRATAAGERVDLKPIQVEKKVFEVRLLGPGLRIYCTRSSGGDLIVLAFGAKNEQRTDIRTALERYRTFSAG